MPAGEEETLSLFVVTDNQRDGRQPFDIHHYNYSPFFLLFSIYFFSFFFLFSDELVLTKKKLSHALLLLLLYF